MTTERPIQLVQDDDDVLAIGDEVPPLFDITEAICCCFRLDRVRFPYGPRLVFHLRIYEPAEYRNQVLKMYVRDPGKKMSIASKLFQLALVVDPDFNPRVGAKKSMFLKKLFRCKLVPSRGAVRYTIVQTFLEKIAG